MTQKKKTASSRKKSDPAAAAKAKLLNRLLIEEFVVVHVNPRCPGLIVPPALAQDANISLKLSRLFNGHLEISPERVRAELLFGDELIECHMPMKAIWAITSHTGVSTIWDDDAPNPIMAHLLRGVEAQQVTMPQRSPDPVEELTPPVKAPKPKPLKAVRFETTEVTESQTSMPEKSKGPRTHAGVTPMLRRIK